MIITAFLSFNLTSVMFPVAMNFMSAKNETYEKFVPVRTDYLVDEQEYFIYIYTHVSIGMLLLGFFLGTLSMTYLSLLYYAIGLFNSIE